MAKMLECDRCAVTVPQPKGAPNLPQHEMYVEVDVYYYETPKMATSRKHLCPDCLSSLLEWLGDGGVMT